MGHAAFVNVPAHGHINPTLPLVTELVRRGERVTYFGFLAFQDATEQAGATFVDLGDLPLDQWAYDHGVVLDFSRPGRPTDNPFIKSFNGSFRDECLNIHWFLSLEDAREKIESWRGEYNHFRLHSALRDIPPGQFSEQLGVPSIRLESVP